MNTDKTILSLHHEHREWLEKLQFYKKELKIMQNLLVEIASKNNHIEILKAIEHFQNNLIIQNEQIDILLHEIKLHEQKIQQSIKSNPVASDHRKFSDHADQRGNIARFEVLFGEMRKDLRQFLAKWL